jgi:ATP/maltotriose-dependent transcriptional regulator MalT
VTDAALQKYYVADPEVVGRCMQAWAEALKDGGGAETRDGALVRARAVTGASGHAFTRAFGLSILASACQTRGEAGAALDLSRQARQLSREHRFTYWEAWSQIVLGWAEAVTGDTERGIARLRDGLDRYVRTGSRQIVPYAKALLAEICLAAGRIREAMAALEEIDETDAGQRVSFYDARIAALRERVRQAEDSGTAVGR